MLSTSNTLPTATIVAHTLQSHTVLIQDLTTLYLAEQQRNQVLNEQLYVKQTQLAQSQAAIANTDVLLKATYEQLLLTQRQKQDMQSAKNSTEVLFRQEQITCQRLQQTLNEEIAISNESSDLMHTLTEQNDERKIIINQEQQHNQQLQQFYSQQALVAALQQEMLTQTKQQMSNALIKVKGKNAVLKQEIRQKVALNTNQAQQLLDMTQQNQVLKSSLEHEQQQTLSMKQALEYQKAQSSSQLKQMQSLKLKNKALKLRISRKPKRKKSKYNHGSINPLSQNPGNSPQQTFIQPQALTKELTIRDPNAYFQFSPQKKLCLQNPSLTLSDRLFKLSPPCSSYATVTSFHSQSMLMQNIGFLPVSLEPTVDYLIE